MSQPAPTCPRCGGLSTNPNAAQCRFCGAPFGGHAAPYPLAYGAQQQQQPHAPYPPPHQQQQQQQQAHFNPGGYGAPQQGYGAPQGYAGYAAPQPYAAQPYAAPYAAPPHPGYGGYPQPYGGVYGTHVRSSGWSNGWTSYLWMRLVIAGIVIGISLLGACINAMSN